ncbi:hypothetical protein DE146DRAFT_660317 [Phaeosphaeria sp. MPI-PUGE-AT-0046c]|nr:hypothetical protein DE146DRAFT_660317 [Phaeosphaeria sp. MPI-PUGE-AT-0046c]
MYPGLSCSLVNTCSAVFAFGMITELRNNGFSGTGMPWYCDSWPSPTATTRQACNMCLDITIEHFAHKSHCRAARTTPT